MSTVRGFRAILILGLLLTAAACGTSGTRGASGTSGTSGTRGASGTKGTDQLTGTAPLALQSSAPVWGGDSQPATTDIVRVAISQRQAEEMAIACRHVPTDLPNSGAGSCEQKLNQAVNYRLIPPSRCLPLCYEMAYVQSEREAQPDAFVQIVDLRPGAPLCSSGPGGLCFRLGAQKQVLQRLAPAAPSEPPSSTFTSEPTDASTPTDTGNPTPTVTNAPSSLSPTTPVASPTSGASP